MDKIVEIITDGTGTANINRHQLHDYVVLLLWYIFQYDTSIYRR